jgi:hypothetical protein
MVVGALRIRVCVLSILYDKPDNVVCVFSVKTCCNVVVRCQNNIYKRQNVCDDYCIYVGVSPVQWIAQIGECYFHPFYQNIPPELYNMFMSVFIKGTRNVVWCLCFQNLNL